jgi:hypothetical protein
VPSKALGFSRVPLLRRGLGTTLLVPASQSDRNQAHIVADFSVHFEGCFLETFSRVVWRGIVWDES